MKTSKSPVSSSGSASGRASASTSARGRTRATTPRTAAKPAVKSAVKKKATSAVATVTKAAKEVARKVSPPKDEQTRVHDLLADFSSVMLLTGATPGGELRARPMAVAKLDDDCTLTFMTGLDTAKVDESRKDGVGYVIAQGKTVFVSMRGTVEIVRDRHRIHDLWTAAAKVYFPRGKDDPNLCLLVVHPEAAEVWDVSGARGLGYLVEAARALFTGSRPRRDADTHDTIDLHAAATTAQA